MRTNYVELASDTFVPQVEPLDENQVRNNAGGFVYALDDFARLDRFLILGSETSTYYQKANKLTRENAKNVSQCWKKDPNKTAEHILSVSIEGRAPKVSPALFALALGAVHDDVAARRIAFSSVGRICRTASHLFEFVANVQGLGKGWGRALKNCVRAWYETHNDDSLGYQMIKYRERNGYSHARLINLSHPRAGTGEDAATRQALYAWGIKSAHDEVALPSVVRHHIAAMKTDYVEDVVKLIRDGNLPWEGIPTKFLTEKKVWRALLPKMGMTAMIRNLGTMTRLGVLDTFGPSGSEDVSFVCDMLTNEERLVSERVHPFAVLNALSIYKSGHALKGSTVWKPNREIVDALNDAFYKAFKTIVPTGKRTLLSLDISGSMGTNILSDSTLSAREASAAMALVTMSSERHTRVCGFSHEFVDLDISPRMRLDRVVKEISNKPFGSTDCSLPMVTALEKGWNIDVFHVYTDNETYRGRIHPSVALANYRKATGIDAKLIVVGMTSTGFTIADPDDAGMLDVVGFDSNAPALMADFVR